MLEDGGAVVAKFYRPGRWSDAQILEEHAFALELAAAEVPVVAPLVAGARRRAACCAAPPTLALRTPQRRLAPLLAVRRAAPAARPSWNSPTRCAAWAASSAAARGGARQPFVHRHRLDAVPTAARAARAAGPGGFVDRRPSCRPGPTPAQQALAAGRRRLRRHRPAARCACTATATRATCCGATPARTWSTWTTPAWARRCRTCGCCCRASPTRWRAARHAAATATRLQRLRRRELALIEPLRTLRMMRHSAWLAERWGDPAFPAAFPFFGSAAYWSQQTRSCASSSSRCAERRAGRRPRRAPRRVQRRDVRAALGPQAASSGSRAARRPPGLRAARLRPAAPGRTGSAPGRRSARSLSSRLTSACSG
jgi:hypothetical protein